MPVLSCCFATQFCEECVVHLLFSTFVVYYSYKLFGVFDNGGNEDNTVVTQKLNRGIEILAATERADNSTFITVNEYKYPDLCCQDCKRSTTDKRC